ncbi:hypothetical protein KUTeg_004519 [Tegillarca granosa]|uniref:Uncharacterized protein n=1 Tax=Tegillarca granosa TaxID=220873 RepID=A0ABQ9FQ82_TEGGR|nr:hypothetical protein KUTeg_004519 [Tegillarca granosa]
MASGGYGRGGRGAALLQALGQPVRKPGESQDDNAKTTKQVPGASALPSQPTAPAALGRGQYLSLLQGIKPASQTQTQTPSGPPSAPGGSGAPPAMPMGRGLAAVNLLLKGISIPGQTPAQEIPKPTLPQPIPPTSMAAQATTESPVKKSGFSPPASRFAQMSVEETKPVVSRPGSDGKRPQVDSKRARFAYINRHKDVIGNTKAFDGSILYLPIKLPNQETVIQAEDKRDSKIVTITIRLTRVVPPEQCVQLYNIIFRRIMNILQMVQVGRYYYNPQTPAAVPQHKLEVWPGYITAVKENEGGLMLLADASHRVLRTETVAQVMQNIFNKNPTGFRDDCVRVLVGCVVLTRYNNKTYRIDDILWDKSPKDTFTSSKSGTPMTFMDYYRDSYSKQIEDADQPLLLHRPKRPKVPGGKEMKSEAICLVPELCYLTGLSDELRQDFRVMKDLATHTRVTPQQRQNTMKKFIRSVNNNQEANQELLNWGLELQEETLHIEGRQVPEEKVYFSNNVCVPAGPNADWNREVTRQTVLTAVDLQSWVVLYTKRDQGKANDYIQMMLKCCPQMGIRCNAPVRLELQNDRTETIIRSLRDHINPQVQMVVIICPTSRDDRYSAIKKLCCVECPVPSQVIIAKTISKQDKLRSVTQKIALQINCKLGGELWALTIPMKELMIVGIDVYHDATKGKRSIAGFVSSTNRTCTRWYSRVCFQTPGQELIDGLKMCLTSAIRKYHEVNHSLPEKIVVFRDGVGDGQLNTVAGYEAQQLQQCFDHFGENYKPKLAITIVQKRINTRIFLKGNRDMENPGPGTVVDHTVTRREWYDFFLVSQHVRQGTVSPTHYIVVYDDTNMKPDHMQRLSYKLTHLYYNWPGTVRVPAPCQYAHKLAYLVGQNIHKEPSTALSDRLFFL